MATLKGAKSRGIKGQTGEPVIMFKRASKVVLATCVVAFLLIAPSWAAPVHEKYLVQEYEDIAEMGALLQSLVPDVHFEAEGSILSLTAGSSEAMEEALELLRQLDKPVARLALEVQLIGLSSTEQESLGLRWHQAARGTSWGVQLLDYFFAYSPEPLTKLPGPLPSQEKVAKSGKTTSFAWRDSQNLDLGVLLELRASVRSENNVFCTLVAHSRLPGRVVESDVDLTIRSGESTAIRNWFPPESRLPAFADLPTLGSLFGPPAEPIIILTPKILTAGQGW